MTPQTSNNLVLGFEIVIILTTLYIVYNTYNFNKLLIRQLILLIEILRNVTVGIDTFKCCFDFRLKNKNTFLTTITKCQEITDDVSQLQKVMNWFIHKIPIFPTFQQSLRTFTGNGTLEFLFLPNTLFIFRLAKLVHCF